MHVVMERIQKLKIVPVVKLDDAEQAIPLAGALWKGGLPAAEITFRTDSAAEAIERIHSKMPDILLGAGTVLNVDDARRAVKAGAQFLVSPGFSRRVVEFAKERGIPVFPGVCTPTEVMEALDYQLEVVKFFPAGQFGGLDTIKALSAPFVGIRFMPTGGSHAGNLAEYLKFDKVIACGGSWMVKDSLIKEGRFDEIAELAAEAVRIAAPKGQGEKNGEI